MAVTEQYVISYCTHFFHKELLYSNTVIKHVYKAAVHTEKGNYMYCRLKTEPCQESFVGLKILILHIQETIVYVKGNNGYITHDQIHT